MVFRGLMSQDREEVGEHRAEPDGGHSERRRWQTRMTSASNEKMVAFWLSGFGLGRVGAYCMITDTFSISKPHYISFSAASPILPVVAVFVTTKRQNKQHRRIKKTNRE
jgi:hypothetical protein